VKKKFQWSNDVFESVNWDAFKHEAKKLDVNRRTNLLKYIYEWLPIGKTLNRIDPTASTKCPSCDCAVETPKHMFCCPKAERQQITTDCIKQITEVCTKWNTTSDLIKEVERSLQFWIAHPKNVPPYAHVINQELRDALQDQSRIGWGHFFKGFIAVKFQKLINQPREPPLNKFEQIKWTCEVIKPIWRSEHEHWTHRNKDRHGHTQEEEANIKRERVLQRAHELFAIRNQIE
jgi:hypothetical protein